VRKQQQKKFYDPGAWERHEPGIKDQKFFARFFLKKRRLL